MAWELAAYTTAMVLVLGWPTPTTPVVDTLAVVSHQVQAVGASGWLNDSQLEFLANIALFMPFGLLVTALLRRGSWWAAVLMGFGFSLTAELTQLLVLPQRSGTVSDVVANTLGTMLGAAIAAAVRTPRAVALPHPLPSRLPPPPTPIRPVSREN